MYLYQRTVLSRCIVLTMLTRKCTQMCTEITQSATLCVSLQHKFALLALRVIHNSHILTYSSADLLHNFPELNF
jgi:hypothetical protein